MQLNTWIQNHFGVEEESFRLDRIYYLVLALTFLLTYVQYLV